MMPVIPFTPTWCAKDELRRAHATLKDWLCTPVVLRHASRNALSTCVPGSRVSASEKPRGYPGSRRIASARAQICHPRDPGSCAKRARAFCSPGNASGAAVPRNRHPQSACGSFAGAAGSRPAVMPAPRANRERVLRPGSSQASARVMSSNWVQKLLHRVTRERGSLTTLWTLDWVPACRAFRTIAFASDPARGLPKWSRGDDVLYSTPLRIRS